MVRPRAYSDETLLLAAHQTILELGDRATLSDIAQRAGVTPAALTKRFGTKRGLLVQLSRRWVENLDDQIIAAETSVPDPTERIVAIATIGLTELDRPEQVGIQLSALADDLRDPHMRELLSEGWGKVIRHLEQLCESLISLGHLVNAPPPKQAARILVSLVQGGSLYWSVNPQGSLEKKVRSDVKAVIKQWTENQESQPMRSNGD